MRYMAKPEFARLPAETLTTHGANMTVIADHIKESKLHLEYLLREAKRQNHQHITEFLEYHGVPEAIERAEKALELVLLDDMIEGEK